jgi:hypothetical protein
MEALMRGGTIVGTLVFLVLLSSYACKRDDALLQEMVAAGPDIGVGPAIRVLEAGSRDDTLSIASPGSVVSADGSFLLADVANDRIMRIDSMFGYVGELGRSGAGPGELDVPMRLVRHGDELFVGELANSRYSIFDRDGTFKRVIAATNTAASFAVRSDGRILAAGVDERHYARLIEADGTSERAVLERPAALAVPTGAAIGAHSTAVLVGPGDTAHVFDDVHGVLLKYDDRGALVLARRLPVAVLEAEQQRRNALAKDIARQGHRLVSAPYLKTMSFADDGSIVLLITRDSLAALRVDPADYRYRRIAAGLDAPDLFYLRTATDAVIRRGRLYAFSANGLAVYPLVEDL